MTMTMTKTWRELTVSAYALTAAAAVARGRRQTAENALEKARAEWWDERDEPAYQLARAQAETAERDARDASERADAAWAEVAAAYVREAP